MSAFGLLSPCQNGNWSAAKFSIFFLAQSSVSRSMVGSVVAVVVVLSSGWAEAAVDFVYGGLGLGHDRGAHLVVPVQRLGDGNAVELNRTATTRPITSRMGRLHLRYQPDTRSIWSSNHCSRESWNLSSGSSASPTTQRVSLTSSRIASGVSAGSLDFRSVRLAETDPGPSRMARTALANERLER